MKHGGGSIMVQGAISARGVGSMDKKMYVQKTLKLLKALILLFFY